MASCLSTQSCYWNLIQSAGVAIGSLPPNKLFFRRHNFSKHELTISCAHRSKTRIAATEKTQNPITSPNTLTTLHPQKRDTKDRNVELCDKPDGYPTWARTVEDVAGFYNVDVSEGLCTEAVTGQRDIHGWNELDKVQGTPFWKLVLEQFEDTLVQILLAAAGVSFLLAFSDSEHVEESGITAFTEPLVILAIVALNGVIGVWQESKAESTLQALKEMQPEYARVLREGEEIVELPARELVPGDIVELRAGDKVPADMRIAYLKSGTVRLQQASLTGESQPVLKQPEAGEEEDIELQQKDNMVFAGTTVSNGSCVCIVTNTGMATEIGKIQAQIQDASLANYDSPLTRKLDEFASLLTKVVGAICVVVWLVNYKYFIAWDPNDGSLLFNFEQATYYFKVAVALAVAAIPEGLPAVITTCLALGTRRMAEENAIVRRLPSVETLGCTTVICSDKTGTLTTNQMSVVQLVAMDSSENLRYLKVTGTSYDPNDGSVIDMPAVPDANLQTIAEICALCNDAGIMYKGGSYTATGMPTEAALLVLVEKLGVPDQSLEADICHKKLVDSIKGCLGACSFWSRKYTRQFTLEFDRLRKSMGVIVRLRNNCGISNKLFVKGAAEFVLERCTSVQLKDGSVVPLTPKFREKIIASINIMTSKSLRVLACAFKSHIDTLADYDGTEHPAHDLLLKPENYILIESQLTFAGLTALQDPPRPEVRTSIEDCRRAGIRVIVITGDNKNTAEAICHEIGLFSDNDKLSSQSFTGKEFMRLSSSDRRSILYGNENAGAGLVFSRAEPIHKQEIVRLLKERGDIVAMTGDGVNDAPALKLADIGIAMGVTGTEVAKEASDMVLADDNFATIVVAIKEGRAIYDNMKSFIRYLISSNIGEVVAIFLTALLGFPQGLLPVQLLWVNLVTDGAPATALGFNPPDKDIMDRPPRLPTEGFISGWTFFRFMAIGIYVGLATIGIFALWYLNDESFLGIDLSSDGHIAVSFEQLSHWGDCASWSNLPLASGVSNACELFTTGKLKPSTLAMSTLVTIEMFNALNALSETNSLLTVKPWANKWLILAILVSMGLHMLILYTPWLANIFGVVPLNFDDWLLVLAFSFPVIPLDEALKLVGKILYKPRVE